MNESPTSRPVADGEVLSPLEIIGLRLVHARRHRRRSLEEYADAVGISETHLRNVEGGRKSPSLRCLVALCVDLRLDLDRLLDQGCPSEPMSTSTVWADDQPEGYFLRLARTVADLDFLAKGGKPR
ncbi:MAG: helix-turn-helix transcriptional regulator [Planctomycetota bacterium]